MTKGPQKDDTPGGSRPDANLGLPDNAPLGEGRLSLKGSFLSETTFKLWVLGVLGASAVFGLQSFYPDYIGPLSNVFPSAGAFLAFASALLCWRRYGFGVRRKFESLWFFFSLGTGMWFAAEVAWAVYYFLLNVPVPYPSVADVFYIGGYFPVSLALVLYLSTFSVAMSRRRLIYAGVAIVFAFALALGVVMPTELAQHLPVLNVLSDLAYPVLDLVLFSLTVLCLAIFLGGSITKWWYVFGAASVAYVVGDEYFLYQIASGTYYNGSLDDLFFIIGYLTFALAFYAHRREF